MWEHFPLFLAGFISEGHRLTDRWAAICPCDAPPNGHGPSSGRCCIVYDRYRRSLHITDGVHTLVGLGRDRHWCSPECVLHRLRGQVHRPGQIRSDECEHSKLHVSAYHVRAAIRQFSTIAETILAMLSLRGSGSSFSWPREYP